MVGLGLGADLALVKEMGIDQVVAGAVVAVEASSALRHPWHEVVDLAGFANLCVSRVDGAQPTWVGSTATASGECVDTLDRLLEADLVELETAYAASGDFQDDQTYWGQHLPPESGLDQRRREAAAGHDAYTPSASVQLDPAVVGHIKELAKNLRIRRYTVSTAATALLARAWSGSGSEVALDFPVSRRVAAESKTLPAMLAGVVPLVLDAAPELTVGEFCRTVDARLRELHPYTVPEIIAVGIEAGSPAYIGWLLAETRAGGPA